MNFIFIKRDFFKHRTGKTNDKIHRFGVVIFLDNGAMTTPKRWILSLFLPFYEFYFRVVKTIFYERAQRVSKISFLPLENKMHIFAPPYNILYIFQKRKFS